MVVLSHFWGLMVYSALLYSAVSVRSPTMPLKSLMARPKLMRPMPSTRMSRRAPFLTAGSVSVFSFFTRSIFPMYWPLMNTWPKSWISALRVLDVGISGSVQLYIIEPQPMFISSKVLSLPSSILSKPKRMGTYSVSRKVGTVMIPIGALGTAGIFLPSLYFSIVLRNS